LNKTPEVTWYGWDGDRLVTTQTDMQRVQTIYLPGSFTPLVRIETETSELAKAVRRTLAEKFQQEANVTFPPELVAMVDSLEAELQRGELSEASRAWLAQCGLTPEQIQNQMEPEYIPQRKIHLYHCDYRGLPLGLVNQEGKADWSAEYDAWGNVLSENNPHNMKQLIRLPGQQCDEETGLYYNRHRYYDPLQGRYITQDPIGLRGGWNLYAYVYNPVSWMDPRGLEAGEYFMLPDYAAENILKGINSASICENKEYAGLICAKPVDNDPNAKYLFYATPPNRGTEKGSKPFKSPCDDGDIDFAWYHTHAATDPTLGKGNEIFSDADKNISNKYNMDAFLATPGGLLLKYSAKNKTVGPVFTYMPFDMPAQCEGK
ncbi:hypothetical protein DOJ94_24200, partial [Salmonella bongori]|nr:hypothetical protein [Salmonella bongori]